MERGSKSKTFYYALLERKDRRSLAWAARTVILVDPFKTSQVCSQCHKEGSHKDLDERVHSCVHCGVVLDRDTNAALNILRAARKQFSVGTRPTRATA